MLAGQPHPHHPKPTRRTTIPASETNYDEIRQRILEGEEVQLLVTSRLFEKAGDIYTRTCMEIRLRTDAGRWPKREDILLVSNPDNGADDALSVVGSLHRWLNATPATSVEATV